MTKQNKENDLARKQLRKLKEKYELTWPQMSKVFGVSLPTIEAWYIGNRNILTQSR